MEPTAIPYCGSPPAPADFAMRWNFDPLLIAVLGSVCALIWAMRGSHPRPLLAGFTLLVVLFISPLCALSSALFAMRAAHHVVLTALAAPLIALALPFSGRGLIAWTLGHTVVFWAWHTPQGYALALASPWVYWLMQATLLGSAVCLWRAVLSAPPPAATAALLATMVQMGLLGALLTLAGSPVYRWHLTTTEIWGLSPLEDQQLAGVIMWVAGAAIYLLATLRIAAVWFGERERWAST